MATGNETRKYAETEERLGPELSLGMDLFKCFLGLVKRINYDEFKLIFYPDVIISIGEDVRSRYAQFLINPTMYFFSCTDEQIYRLVMYMFEEICPPE